MDYLKLLRSDDAADIEEFFKNIRDNQFYKTLFYHYGSHEILSKEIHNAHKTKFYDKNGKPSFTPSAADSSLYFAKKSCELEIENEMTSAIKISFSKYLNESSSLFNDIELIKHNYKDNNFYTEDGFHHATYFALSINIERHKNETKIIFDELLASKQNEKLEFIFSSLSLYATYRLMLNTCIEQSKSKEDNTREKREPRFMDYLTSKANQDIGKWLHYLEEPRRLYLMH